MNTRQPCAKEGRTARFNLPVCHRSKFRRLLDPFLAPPVRLHRYRTMSAKMLEKTLDDIDNRHCL